jgi:2-oxoglutarate dehydrogenase complex dehydrogenase (E1) component-like enzyme
MDTETGEKHIPLNFLSDDQARYSVIDSLLSEEAALGFEYGYSVAALHGLTMWEAQFGDFVNGAQIQIDQFMAAGEAKWGQASGLTLLLPHGYDGQGPEHSSARPERFLQLCAENNMRVAIPSTPGQYFHLLRKQALTPLHKPLVVMTHKSPRRLRAAGSAPAELCAPAGFQPVLGDASVTAQAVERVVVCTGKVFYDLHQARSDRERDDVAIVRVEQLYPFPKQKLADIFGQYGKARDVRWVQEEPVNMGAWTFVEPRLRAIVGERALRYVGRPASASPATGSSESHKLEQKMIVDDAFETS